MVVENISLLEKFQTKNIFRDSENECFLSFKNGIVKITKNEIYKHYIALDWSQEIVAIASMRDTSTEPEHTTILPDLKIMKQYLKSVQNTPKANRLLALF